MATRRSSNKKQIKKANNKTTHKKRKQTKKNYSAKQPKKFLTQEQKVEVRARDSMRKRLRRANLSTEDLLKLREKEAQQKRIYREKYQTEQQKAAELAKNSKSKRMRRAGLSMEDLLAVRQQEALNKKQRNENLTLEQLDEIRSKDVERKRVERSRIGVRKTNDSYVSKRKSKRKPVEIAAKAAQINANKKSAKKVSFS